MIIFDDKKLIETKFKNEQEIEDLVIANSEHFFGPSSVMIPKAKIKTKDGFGTIPDGFAIDIASRVWYVVEAELGHHNVWTHIAPQVTKQLLAVSRLETRQLLTELLVQMVTEDSSIKEKFEDEGIKEINIRKVLSDIFEKSPIIGMPINTVSNDLREWAETLKNDVRLWIVKKIVKKYSQFGAPHIIAYEIPEEYRPILDTTERNDRSKSGIRTYDVSLSDLVNAGILLEGAELTLSYKPRGGKQRIYKGVLSLDGSITVLEQNYSSLSYAAVACLQDAGSERTTVNGWTSWKTRDGKFLSQLRSEYVAKMETEAEQSDSSDA
ncbi:MAG: hypothetical protein FD151_329 [bacterium]|nr:MAG: hypothetical protein FD151_329 [bacterium]